MADFLKTESYESICENIQLGIENKNLNLSNNEQKNTKTIHEQSASLRIQELLQAWQRWVKALRDFVLIYFISCRFFCLFLWQCLFLLKKTSISLNPGKQAMHLISINIGGEKHIYFMGKGRFPCYFQWRV